MNTYRIEYKDGVTDEVEAESFGEDSKGFYVFWVKGDPGSIVGEKVASFPSANVRSVKKVVDPEDSN